MQAHSYEAAAAGETAAGLDTGASAYANGVSSASGISEADSMGHKTAISTSASGGGSVIALRQAVAERTRRARRFRYALITGRIIADGVLLVASFAIAYWLRYGLQIGRDVIPESFRSLSEFTPYIAAYAIITLVTFNMRGLYSLPRGASWFEHMRIITSGALIGIAALTLGALLLNPVLPSRMLFVLLWVCTLAVFSAERFGYRVLRTTLWRRGINIRQAVVVGSGLAGQRIMKDIAERPELGYTLVGYVSDATNSPRSPEWRIPVKPRNGELRRLGSLKDVNRVIEQQGPHEVIVALPATHHTQILSVMDICRQYGVEFKLVPDLFEMRFNEVSIDALNGVPLIGVKDVALRGFNFFIKRVLDVVLASLALLLAAIPMAVIAVIVKLTSTGPVMFKQPRVGKDRKVFVCYKFRTMYEDAEQRKNDLWHLNEADGPMFKIKNDPRRTPFGSILRKTSLDELPQLFNILRGEMSWVGPRPATIDETEQYEEWHLKRLEVLPGLTGLWQVSGRSDLPFDEMVKLDLYYAENWSLVFDLAIIIKTIPVVLKSEGAY
jgi:exopolysaccharide biosynthesis polyprenyl glycosylphosphotransferase